MPVPFSDCVAKSRQFDLKQGPSGSVYIHILTVIELVVKYTPNMSHKGYIVKVMIATLSVLLYVRTLLIEFSSYYYT